MNSNEEYIKKLKNPERTSADKFVFAFSIYGTVLSIIILLYTGKCLDKDVTDRKRQGLVLLALVLILSFIAASVHIGYTYGYYDKSSKDFVTN